MIFSQPLNKEQRDFSKHNYNVYNLINGASYMCLGETILILLAARINMPTSLLGTVGAMLYVGFLVLPLGIWMTARKGAAQTLGDCWVARNLAALTVAASAGIYYFSPPAAWTVLLLGAFLFYGFRAAGVVVSAPLIGEITTDDDRSDLIGKSTAYFYLTGLFTLILISVTLKLTEGILPLCIIIVIGACLGILASKYLRGIHETEGLRESARRPMRPQISKVLRDPNLRRLVEAGFFATIPMITVIPVSTVAIKRGFLYSDTTAIYFSLVYFGACIFMSWLSGKIIAKIGPRRGMIFGFLLPLIVCQLWIFIIPERCPASILTLILIFFLNGCAIAFVENSFTCYFLMIVDKQILVVSSILCNLIKGAGAGIVGMLLTAFLLRVSEHSTAIVLNDPVTTFKIYFSFMAVILALCYLPILNLKTIIHDYREKHGDEKIRQVVGQSSVPAKH